MMPSESVEKVAEAGRYQHEDSSKDELVSLNAGERFHDASCARQLGCFHKEGVYQGAGKMAPLASIGRLGGFVSGDLFLALKQCGKLAFLMGLQIIEASIWSKRDF